MAGVAFMDLACRFGLHRWRSRPTLRPGVSVHRCARCERKFLTRRGRDRLKKRWWLGAAMIISLTLWYLGVALGFTGHTKILWGAQMLVSGAQHTADQVKHGVGGTADDKPTAK
jgi:hypothetical protein